MDGGKRMRPQTRSSKRIVEDDADSNAAPTRKRKVRKVRGGAEPTEVADSSTAQVPVDLSQQPTENESNATQTGEQVEETEGGHPEELREVESDNQEEIKGQNESDEEHDRQSEDEQEGEASGHPNEQTEVERANKEKELQNEQDNQNEEVQSEESETNSPENTDDQSKDPESSDEEDDDAVEPGGNEDNNVDESVEMEDGGNDQDTDNEHDENPRQDQNVAIAPEDELNVDVALEGHQDEQFEQDEQESGSESEADEEKVTIFKMPKITRQRRLNAEAEVRRLLRKDNGMQKAAGCSGFKIDKGQKMYLIDWGNGDSSWRSEYVIEPSALMQRAMNRVEKHFRKNRNSDCFASNTKKVKGCTGGFKLF